MSENVREPVRADELVDAELDRQAIAHLDKGIDPTCGFGVRHLVHGVPDGDNVKCGKPAAWIATCRRCNGLYWACDDCKHATFLLDKVACGGCGAKMPGKDLFTFDRIPGGA